MLKNINNIISILILMSKLPFVSVCTPTFNRRPFIPYLIKCFQDQTYPISNMEWIIIDDGSDKIEDLVKDLEYVKYFKYDEKMTIGKKRNLLNKKSKGDIIVYMDDDDYYPPQRVEHAVSVLQKNPNILCVGSSELYIYFNKLKELYRFGPYRENHATAATLAFKKELLKQTSFQDNAALSEEKHFLKNYSIPLKQLESLKTILVFSHLQNTFDKCELLKNKNKDKFVNKSNIKVKTLIKNKELSDFYINDLNTVIENYKPGSILFKPDVIKQKQELEILRNKQVNSYIQMKVGSETKFLNKDEVVNLLSMQHETIQQQAKIIEGKNLEIRMLKDKQVKDK